MSLALSRIERQPQTVTAACPNHNPGPPQPPDDTGQAIRLHLVSGDPPDPKKPHIRLVGRIGWVAPTRVDGTGNGGWHRQTIRLHLVSGDPPDPKKPHIRLAGRIGWVAPTRVDGTDEGGWHRQAIRLHLVSGDPPDPKKPHLRLGGRIGWVAPATVGGTGQAIPLAELGEWHRVRWVALGDVFQEP